MFIVLDTVQFIRRGWQHRDKIKTPRGAEWLSLRLAKGDYHQRIDTVALHPERGAWVEANLNLVRENYRDAAAFETHFPAFVEIWQRPFERMVDLNLAFIDHLLELLKIDVTVVRASSLPVTGQRNDLLINLCREIGATRYLSGTGALAYLDRNRFADAGIDVEIQEFCHPAYPQLHGSFLPGLSVLDLVLNCGDGAAQVLRG